MSHVFKQTLAQAGGSTAGRGQQGMESMEGATQAGQDMIVFDGVSKQYGGAPALHATDLTVRKGEFLSLLGPSGSGKSTILNIIAGSIAPSSGRILLDGRDVSTVPASVPATRSEPPSESGATAAESSSGGATASQRRRPPSESTAAVKRSESVIPGASPRPPVATSRSAVDSTSSVSRRIRPSPKPSRATPP